MTAWDAAVVEALGWALLHFVWQGILAAAGLALLDFVTGRWSARLRYALATATLLVMASLPVVTFATLRGRVETPSASGAGAASSAGRSGDARGPSSTSS